MIVAIGSDKLGYILKEAIKEYLEAEGHLVIDLGTLYPKHSISYVNVSDSVAKEIVAKKADRGIVICGSGVGVCIVANKHKGAYCVHAESLWVAQNARQVNNVNMLSLGANMLGNGMAIDIVNAFLTTDFAPGASSERRAMLQGFLNELKIVEGKEFLNQNEKLLAK